MKRKMSLIHKILEWTECHADGDPKMPPELVKDTETPRSSYHIGLVRFRSRIPDWIKSRTFIGFPGGGAGAGEPGTGV